MLHTTITNSSGAVRNRARLISQILQLLRTLTTGIETERTLSQLFCSELQYQSETFGVCVDGWEAELKTQIESPPTVVATAAQNGTFHIIHIRLASDLLLPAGERTIISRLYADHPHALFLFSNRHNTSWHFISVNQSGSAVPHHFLRRIAVEPGTRLHIASERIALLNLAKLQQSSPREELLPSQVQSIHESAFDAQKVHKQFFDATIEVYNVIVKNIRTILGDTGSEPDELTQLLLDRLLFLSFIQRKGWLAGGNHHYLYDRFCQCNIEGASSSNNYYSQFLQHLFDQLSNTETSNSRADGNAHIPAVLLSGAELFQIQKRSEGPVFSQLSNSTFHFIFDRLLEYFDFTLSEDTAFDEEIAVGPEMLGTIFERLVLQLDTDPDSNLRKTTGSFYTPHRIVRYMSQECLRALLLQKAAAFPASSSLPWHAKLDALLGAPPADQLDQKEREILHGLFTMQEAKFIKEALCDLTVCDPAVGSGAFIVGMLHEFVSLISKLDLVIHGAGYITSVNYRYRVKRALIKNNLYGVDIQEQAVRLCQLRLWLSLLVEFECGESFSTTQQLSVLPSLGIECGQRLSLPDLSCRFVAADSLVERHPGQLYKARSGDNINPTPRSTNMERSNGSAVERTTRESFAWQLYFAEVLSQNGFDIVIGNPPYRGHGMRGNKRADDQWTKQIRKLFPGSAEYKIEQYALFFELALRITKEQGIVCFITPDSFLLGMYFQKLRRTILENAAIRKIVQVGKDFWKSGVVGRPTVTLLQKCGEIGDITAVYAHTEEDVATDRALVHSYPQQYFNTVPLKRFRLFYSALAKRLVEQVERNAQPLRTVAHIWSGIRSKIGQQNIQSKLCHNEHWKKGITTSSLVLPLLPVQWDGDYLHIEKEILWSGGWDASLVEAPKVMIRQTGDRLIAGLDFTSLYHLNNVHGLSLLNQSKTAALQRARSLEFICALLNSSLMRRYYHLVSLEFGRTMAQTDIETLELLPVREPSAEVVAEVINLIHQPDCERKLRRIDEIFEQLYELDDELLRCLRSEDLYTS